MPPVPNKGVPVVLLRLSSTLLTLAFALTGALLLYGCSAEYPTVVMIKLATVPAGGTADALGAPARDNQSLRFTWNVETSLDREHYVEWVTAGLIRSGFALRPGDQRFLTFSKLDGGDAYRLTIEVTQEHPTRAQVILTLSPG